MPEGVGYGPQNTASVGLNLNIIGNHAYAYSGLKASSGTPTNYLEFTTGNYYFQGLMEPQYKSDSNNNLEWVLSLNDLDIIALQLTSSKDNYLGSGPSVIIPPYTTVKVAIDNLSGAADIVGVTLTGRIYK
jgi:hypothetical protein